MPVVRCPGRVPADNDERARRERARSGGGREPGGRSRARHPRPGLRRAPRDAQALVATDHCEPDRGPVGRGASGRLPAAPTRPRRRRLRVSPPRGAGAPGQGHGHRGGGEDPERDGARRPHRAPRRAARGGDAPAPQPAHAAGAVDCRVAARLSRGQHRPAHDAGLRARPARVARRAGARAHPALRPRQRDAVDPLRDRRRRAADRRGADPEDPARPRDRARRGADGPPRGGAQGRGQPGVGGADLPARGPRGPARHGFAGHAHRHRHRRRRARRGGDGGHAHAAALRRHGSPRRAVSADALLRR